MFIKKSLFLLLVAISTVTFGQSAKTAYSVAISKLNISCNTKLRSPKLTIKFDMKPANPYSGQHLVYQIQKNNTTTVALGTFVSRTPNIIELEPTNGMVLGAKYTLTLRDEQNNLIVTKPFVYKLLTPCSSNATMQSDTIIRDRVQKLQTPHP